jgi:1,4-alpha-glucan branching enzyme
VNVFHVNNADKLLAFHRWRDGGAGDDVVVVANFANRTWMPEDAYRIGLPRAGTWQVRFNSDRTRYGDDYGNIGPASVATQDIPYDGFPCSATISVAPYSVLILSR